MGFNEFMTKLFGNKSQRDLKEITPYVDKVKAVYPSIKALSNDELRAKTDEIKQRIQDYVAEEKAQVEELRKGIEDKELEEREAIWAEVKSRKPSRTRWKWYWSNPCPRYSPS